MAVSAGEAVVPASELAAARAGIAKLQRVLGKKILEHEILKEAVEYAAEKIGLHAHPCKPGTTSEDGLPGTGVSTVYVSNVITNGDAAPCGLKSYGVSAAALRHPSGNQATNAKFRW